MRLYQKLNGRLKSQIKTDDITFYLTFWDLKLTSLSICMIFVVSGSIKKLFSIYYVNINFSQSIVNHLFSVDLKVWVYPTLLISWFIKFRNDIRKLNLKAAYLSFHWLNDSWTRGFELVTRGFELLLLNFKLCLYVFNS